MLWLTLHFMLLPLSNDCADAYRVSQGDRGSTHAKSHTLRACCRYTPYMVMIMLPSCSLCIHAHK